MIKSCMGPIDNHNTKTIFSLLSLYFATIWAIYLTSLRLSGWSNTLIFPWPPIWWASAHSASYATYLFFKFRRTSPTINQTSITKAPMYNKSCSKRPNFLGLADTYMETRYLGTRPRALTHLKYRQALPPPPVPISQCRRLSSDLE